MKEMKDIRNEQFRLRDRITGELEETWYTVGMDEPDDEYPDLVWLYLVSEYSDENVEYEPKYNLYYAKLTNNQEGLLV